MYFRVVAVVALGMTMLALASGLSAAPALTGSVKATLSGYEEVPTLSTPGSGEFRAQIGADTIQFELSYAGTESAVTAAHIHIGARATNGDVVAFLCGGGGKPPCPAAPARVTGTINASNVMGPGSMNQGIAAGEFAELARAMINDATYANVHTTNRPGGEIRGQITRGN